MSETITYTATNTDIQVVDTFDPGLVKAISYTAQIDAEADTSFVQIKVVQDGNTVGITQQGLSVSDAMPVTFEANISSGVGRIWVTPDTQPTVIVLERTDVLANNYAEHTKCGRWIKHTEGFAMNPTTLVIRQTNNNIFDDTTDYLVANTLGPITDGPNLLSNPTFTDTSGWIPHNDAVLSVGSMTTNNVYKDNFIYQHFEAELGYCYRADVSANNGSLIVGSTLSDNNYVDANLALYVERTFTPNTVNSVYYSIGHTSNEQTNLYEAVVYKIVPFNTYRWDEGTMFLKWSNTAVNTVLWEMLTVEGYPRELKVNADGNVQLTENTSIFVIGAQAGGNNKLAFSYANGFIASLNGNAVVSNLNIEILDNVVSLEFVTQALQFSYVPTVISNSELVVLSNG